MQNPHTFKVHRNKMLKNISDFSLSLDTCVDVRQEFWGDPPGKSLKPSL